MIVCPVCEHQQDFGVECDVCGKNLGGLDDLGPPPVQEQRLDGLEVTMHQPSGEVPVERVGELEVTAHAPVQVAVEVTPDLELNRQADAGPVAVQRMAEMQVDRVPDDGQRTVLPSGPITCRYCRNVQETGAVCDRCGMRLPKVRMASAGPTQEALVAAGERTKCPKCNSPAHAGRACVTCGSIVPAAE